MLPVFCVSVKLQLHYAIQQCSVQYTQCVQYILHAEAQQLEDKMADLSLASKVQHNNVHVQYGCAIDCWHTVILYILLCTHQRVGLHRNVHYKRRNHGASGD